PAAASATLSWPQTSWECAPAAFVIAERPAISPTARRTTTPARVPLADPTRFPLSLTVSPWTATAGLRLDRPTVTVPPLAAYADGAALTGASTMTSEARLRTSGPRARRNLTGAHPNVVGSSAVSAPSGADRSGGRE